MDERGPACGGRRKLLLCDAVPVRFRDTNVVAFTRDEQGRLLLETSMLSTSRDPRMTIQESFWICLAIRLTLNVHQMDGW